MKMAHLDESKYLSMAKIDLKKKWEKERETNYYS